MAFASLFPIDGTGRAKTVSAAGKGFGGPPKALEDAQDLP